MTSNSWHRVYTGPVQFYEESELELKYLFNDKYTRNYDVFDANIQIGNGHLKFKIQYLNKNKLILEYGYQV